ncbi:hypothetical protein ElyMa_005921400 [Elysia marginata]|uniref:Uncharacterized protein n=1 Tax=Elysia marginata TaxID=1093978 RepID=A0AAV4G783_9GAST|nr:hypothetical protein ElyMa_005921400 [Elysia marginata]
MESRFVSRVFKWTHVSSPVIRLSNRLSFARKPRPGPALICVVSSSPLSHWHAAEGVVKFQLFEACDPLLTFLEPILHTPSDMPECQGLFHEPYSLEFRDSKQSRKSSSSSHI